MRSPSPQPLSDVPSSSPLESQSLSARSASTPLGFHPYAEIFPLLEGEAFEELVADIRANGCLEEIVLLDGKILDGRNRYRALLRLVEDGDCGEDDIDPGASWGILNFEDEYPNADPLHWVLSKNLRRRHLSESQRAMVAAKLATLSPGRPRIESGNPANLPVFDEAPSPGHPADGGGPPSPAGGRGVGGEGAPTQAHAAELLNVSERTVRSARTVVEQGAPELKYAVEQGEIAVSAAAEVARLPEAEQRRLVEVGSSEFNAEVKRLRAERQAGKRERREVRERELGARQRALPEKRYGVIYADPPWRFEPRSQETGMDRAADNHYPTMTLHEILALPVREIAAEDCVLFLWATAPMLVEALDVLMQWGFDYRSHAVWEKTHPGPGRAEDGAPRLMLGTGYWFRNVHELLLVGVRGRPPAPAMGEQELSVMAIPGGAHSEKPSFIAKLIEEMFPTLPKIELFARVARDDWDVWGNQVPEEGGATALLAPDTRHPTPEIAAGPRGEGARQPDAGGHPPDTAAHPEPVAPEGIAGEPQTPAPTVAADDLRRDENNALPPKRGVLDRLASAFRSQSSG